MRTRVLPNPFLNFFVHAVNSAGESFKICGIDDDGNCSLQRVNEFGDIVPKIKPFVIGYVDIIKQFAKKSVKKTTEVETQALSEDAIATRQQFLDGAAFALALNSFRATYTEPSVTKIESPKSCGAAQNFKKHEIVLAPGELKSKSLRHDTFICAKVDGRARGILCSSDDSTNAYWFVTKKPDAKDCNLIVKHHVIDVVVGTSVMKVSIPTFTNPKAIKKGEQLILHDQTVAIEKQSDATEVAPHHKALKRALDAI